MDYDAIVIGGGHAGIEASLALARMGFSTLVITQSLDAIGRLSCNPAVGGLAKGNIVREVDALGGEMGHLIDKSMIQFRILNRRRGPAVQSPRAQADKFTYSRIAKQTLEAQKGLHLFMDTVVDLLENPDHSYAGVITERGHRITSRVLVLTTGTFMEGRIFIGEYDAQYGRLDEPAAIGLGTNLRRLGFEVGRLKTGTPARVRRSSLDLEAMEKIKGKKKIISVHSRKAENELFDLLCEYNIQNVIFHWYTGPIDLIPSIISKGYYFSINEAMTISNKGRAIIKVIPRNRILTESDAPFNNKTDIKEAQINMHITENEVKNNFMELLSRIK